MTMDTIHGAEAKRIDEAVCSRANVECPICGGTAWVCENHPDTAWLDGDGCACGGAGIPCRCTGME